MALLRQGCLLRRSDYEGRVGRVNQLMKKKKNSKPASQFPNIYRTITESGFFKNLEKNEFRLLNQPKLKKPIAFISIILVFLAVLLLLAGIGIFSIKLYKYFNSYRQISAQRQNLEEKVNFWQSIADKYEGYKDAYFQIALLEYRLGNFEKAKEYNNKALILDPNFEDAKKLEALLEGK